MNDGYIDWRLKIEDGSIKEVTNMNRKITKKNLEKKIKKKKIFMGKKNEALKSNH